MPNMARKTLMNPSVFTFSSNQHIAISITIAIFTGMVSFQLGGYLGRG